ncbi:MAG: ribosome biogenesis GTP-binding protein YihA/YsxC [Pseudomonadota bacterium]
MVPPARFLISAVAPDQFPLPDRPEVAFAGRSNVGKSSLLNRLLNRRNLAHTSRTPGRTQTINFFEVGRDMYFVDLPGYGYAKVPVSVRATWGPMVERYLTAPRDLRLVVLLVDIRREPGQEESGLIAWLESLGASCLPVATKADKVSRGQRPARLAAIEKRLGPGKRPLVFSAATGEGFNEVWQRIYAACGRAREGGTND